MLFKELVFVYWRTLGGVGGGGAGLSTVLVGSSDDAGGVMEIFTFSTRGSAFLSMKSEMIAAIGITIKSTTIRAPSGVRRG
jgi:hypothetical protein